MNTLQRLQTYLKQVEYNIIATDGPLREFWIREKRKTKNKLERLTLGSNGPSGQK